MLGFRYIWVDRYCVPQDDEKAKQSQIELMGEIYAASALTIIAAAGDGPQYGLVGISRPMTASPQGSSNGAIQASPYSFAPIRALSPNKIVLPKASVDIQGEIQKSKWNTRGWTYQEAILSTRRLVFTSSCIYFQGPSPSKPRQKDSWVFRSGITHIVFPNPDNAGLDWCGTGTRDDLFSVTRLLREHASNYVRRDLTYERDAYAAFRGIQSYLEKKLGGYLFFYGLQLLDSERNPAGFRSRRATGHGPGEKSLAAALLWTFTGNLSSASRRADVPSWTWLGWKLGHDRDVNGPVWPRDYLHAFISEMALVDKRKMEG
ncbi:hypothetical protein NKR19_g6912 [Coniochaeta hoffmannii]|uniref:Heterokaryon incompatibility domain-containing protein n=1 Tax=Coniochaeta hoffmannii TaxID=91930 RepID=A0AA38RK94_9PEZI|nr:hypothetical protein NKR19_g6912 [Coniochaeta hoffmannii]